MNLPLEWWHADEDEKHERLAAKFLRSRSGLPFCDACIAHETGLQVEEASVGAWRLWELRQFPRRRHWCTRCLRFTDTTEAPRPGRTSRA